MLQVKLPHKLFNRNPLLFVIFVGILILNSMSLLIIQDTPNSDDQDSNGVRDLIWSNDYAPILSPREACTRPANKSSPEVLVMVPSGLMNFERRAAIRNSWGDTPLVREGKIKVVFVLGQKLSRHGASQVICH